MSDGPPAGTPDAPPIHGPQTTPSVHEEQFERITRLAEWVFDISSATVTLLGPDRRRFTVRPGFGLEVLPPDSPLTSRAARGSELLVVEDTAADPRTAGLALHVLPEGPIRLFVAFPLVVAGVPVGALCLADASPRRIGQADLALLAELAALVEHELDDTGEQARAAAIQRSLLPERAPVAPGWEFCGICVPARAVGGDFLDWRRGPGGRIEMTIADVMGRGTGAGLLAATVRATLRAAALGSPSPAETLHRVADTVHPDLEEVGALVTVLHAWLEPGTGNFTWADAGHGLQAVVRVDGPVEWSRGGGLPLGTVANDVWTNQQAWIEPGDAVVAFSDGVLHLRDGTSSARDDVVAAVRATPDALSGIVAKLGVRARSTRLADDVAFGGFRRRP